MFKLIYGTYNQGKVSSMRRMLEGLKIEILALSDYAQVKGEPEEDGKQPIQNAIIKARYYYDQLKQPLFSCDSGLFFKEVTDEEQPGVRIRRPGRVRLNDEEMIDYYSALAKKYGGRLTAYYKNAVCLILDDETVIEYDDASIDETAFYIVDRAHPSRISGFPLDSLSVDMRSGKYYLDIDDVGLANEDIKNGFRRFFESNLKL